MTSRILDVPVLITHNKMKFFSRDDEEDEEEEELDSEDSELLMLEFTFTSKGSMTTGCEIITK